TMLDQETFYESGTSLSECEFIRPHWDFIGWNTEPDGSGISYPDEAEYVSHSIDKKDEEGNAVLKLYAQWEPTEYTIGYDLAGGTVLEGNPTTYNIETEEFTLKNPERVGYIFLGWTGSNGDKPEKKVTISKGSHGNREYTANWKAEEKTLKFDPNGGEWEDGKTETLAKKADYDSTVIIPDAPAREHYTFEFWEDESGNKYIPGHEYKVRDDQEFKALWEPVQYVIEYDLAGGTVAEDANPTVYTTETDDFTLAAPERDGYIFLGWTGSNGDKPEKEVTIEKGSGGDKSYTANWEPVKTATPEDETKDKGTPTGDSFDPLLWGVLLLSSAAVLAVLYGRRRRSR
ncbi:MAG: InlB B-repeat-containing protein, partial [Anaerovoracaceae bacterium]|nr:InlB B-repeat-containing protein [Anaerovoracaceae bacterium]